MKAKFTYKVLEGYNLRDILHHLITQKDFMDYHKEMAGQELQMEIKPIGRTSEKLQMYDYYHKVILGVAMKAYEDLGWESMDKVKADYFLKAECAKDIMYNAKEDREEIFLLDKSAMTKARLHKFLTDCINYLELELGYRVPDADEWKTWQQTGMRGFKSVNKNKF
jgi:hypothetical protein